jgi:hypothetical protein
MSAEHTREQNPTIVSKVTVATVPKVIVTM